MELENAHTAMGLDRITIRIIIIIIVLRVKVPESVIDVKEPEYINIRDIYFDTNFFNAAILGNVYANSF